MKIAEVSPILKGIADNPELGLEINEVYALIFACAVINSLPENSIKVIDAIFNLAFPELQR